MAQLLRFVYSADFVAAAVATYTDDNVDPAADAWVSFAEIYGRNNLLQFNQMMGKKSVQTHKPDPHFEETVVQHKIWIAGTFVR